MTRPGLSLLDDASARPLVVLATAAAASLSLVLDLDSTVRALLVFSFLLVGPGLALVAPLRLEPVAELTVAVGVSLALDAVVATAMLYAGAWSPEAILLMMAGIAAGAAVLQLIASARGTAAGEGMSP